MSIPRMLVLMGSGETTPTMVKTHREVFARLGPPPVQAVLLDTPFGFQENADDIVERAQAYFAESIRVRVGLASYRSAEEADTLALERFLNQVRSAHWVFAGPGSPTYALAQWRDSGLPALLADKIRNGGVVTFSSAAALTLGAFSIPVYGIYKVGEAPHWEDGLDVLSQIGLHVALIPHYNNAEGGNHDTRFCYLGERRLAIMERTLPEDGFVLGLDEHTGLVIDLDEGRADVVGLSDVVVRVDGRSKRFPTGTTLGIEDLLKAASELAAGGGSATPPLFGSLNGAEREAGGPPLSVTTPLLAAIRTKEAEFSAALANRDSAGAVRATLELDDEITAWATDTNESDEMDEGRATLRSMIVRLGEAADAGLRDPASVLGPFVDTLLRLRDEARGERRFAQADAVRDTLVSLGIEVRDTPGGTEWSIRAADDGKL